MVYVINNGYWDTPIYPTQGSRQGCCYSPAIFTLVVETLGIWIRDDPNIKGITIGGTEINSGQYVDDLWATLVAEKDNLDAMLELLDRFALFLGLHINPDKTVIRRIGSLKDSHAKIYTLKWLYWLPSSIRILGINIHPDLTVMYQENYFAMLEKVRNILGSWHYRDLTLLGKITIVNTLIVPLFIHKFLALPTPPPAFFKQYKEIVLNFLWDKKVPKISYERLLQNYNNHGLKLTDLAEKDSALKAAWLVRWVNRDLKELSWLFEFLSVKDLRLWECKISASDIQLLLPEPTLEMGKQIWLVWSRFNYKNTLENDEEILSATIWGNSLIRHKNLPLFDQKLMTSNIDHILDIVHPSEMRFLTFTEIQETYGLVFDCIYYYGILAAILTLGKVFIRNCPSQHRSDLDVEYAPARLVTNKSGTKLIYWALIEKYHLVYSGSKSLWEIDLSISIDEGTWNQLFYKFVSLVKPAKLKYLQFRVLNRILTTNIKRCKWLKVSPLCTFCKEYNETILHIFWECSHVKKLWLLLEKSCQYFLGVPLKLTMVDTILNNYAGLQQELINYLIIIMKQYIYSTKCFQHKLQYTAYMAKVSYWYLIDKHDAFHSKKQKQLFKKWKNWF